MMTRREAAMSMSPNDKATLDGVEQRHGGRAPWDIVCDMETDVEDIRLFAIALELASSGMDEGDDAAVVQRLAWFFKEKAEAIEERRGVLFRLLHPRRAEFDAAARDQPGAA